MSNIKDLIVCDYERRYGVALLRGGKFYIICKKFFTSIVFRLIVLYRLLYEANHGKLFIRFAPIRALIKIWYKRVELKTGIQISENAKIGRGFAIEHYSNIVIGNAVIGDHCTIFHGVTIGYAGREKGGTPIIGNNCIIASGAKVIGAIKIGNNVFIGANALVCKNIPDNAVVGAPLSTILSYKGTNGYFGNV